MHHFDESSPIAPENFASNLTPNLTPASNGHVFVVAAPSGTGKTSLVNALLSKIPSLYLSVSHTTRPMREGEIDGKNYHFVSVDAFKSMQKEGLFLESAKVFEHYYGTSKPSIQSQLQKGKRVLLEIDCQGADQVRKHFPDASMIFILPPSFEELARRLRGRQSDDEDVIALRLRTARSEIEQYQSFDYLLVNDHFDVALESLSSIVQARSSHRPSNPSLDALVDGLITQFPRH